ncbi:MAG: hypothetical protein GF418_11615 [Chitinivibrionales bacterium]|nr:hypothetical protein [Chitinivibrionales bacterium]MBD3396263.1 hypothetical protein [Chitinivibrionales bacterium]
MSTIRKSPAGSAADCRDASLAFDMLPASSLAMPAGLCEISGETPSEDALVMPLVVCRTGKAARYSIVDGCKRFHAHRKRRTKRIPCAILHCPADKKAIGFMRMRLNRGRLLSLAEKILTLKWIRRHCEKRERMTVADMAGISRQEQTRLAPLLSARKRVTGAVLSGALDIGLVRGFLLMSRADQDAFLDTFRPCRLSYQTQREFLEWLTEISRRDRVTVCSLLKHADIQTVLRSRKLNWPQRVHKIRGLLHALRFPRLSEAESRWNRLASAANPSPAKVCFAHSPAFEKDRFEIRVTVSDPRDAKRLLGRLASVPETTYASLICPLAARRDR